MPKTWKAKKRKVAPDEFVVVGTYKEKQLAWIKKNGVYNYPVREGDDFNDVALRAVRELWLYADVKGTRHCYAVTGYVGKMTRSAFVEKYPTYAKLPSPKPPAKSSSSKNIISVLPKSENRAYYVFEVTKLDYKPTVNTEIFIARTADFGGRSAKVKKAIAQFKADGEFAPLSAYLPKDLSQVPPKQLRVSEEAVQMEFLSFFNTNKVVWREASTEESHERPIAIDLFAGCGGLSLGFEQAGFDIAAAVEIDPIHAAAHEYNFPYSTTICADIKNISGDDIRRLSNIGLRDVDIVFGGAPCQGFSMIGKRALDDPRNQLIGHYLRIVSDIRPKYCVLENVKGLTVGKHAQFLAELIGELKKIRYKVLLPYRVLNAANYGVPQNRERLFLIAARDDQQLPAYPRQQAERVTIQEAIADLPDADRYDQLLLDDSVAVRWQTRSAYARELRGQDEDATNYGYEREFDRNRLTASWRTVHGDVSRERFAAAPQGETEPHSRFFKLAWGGQSNTLRAGTDSARGGFTSPRPIHPVLPRVITVREAARIHSYPDWFRFNKTKWHGFREIGNSVPPRLARAVGSSIIEALGITPVKPDKVIKTGDESLLGFDMSAAASHFGVSRNVIAQRKRKTNGK